MKKLFHYIVAGAGVTLGSVLMHKLCGVIKDPVKKAKWKRKFTNIKNELFNED